MKTFIYFNNTAYNTVNRLQSPQQNHNLEELVLNGDSSSSFNSNKNSQGFLSRLKDNISNKAGKIIQYSLLALLGYGSLNTAESKNIVYMGETNELNGYVEKVYNGNIGPAGPNVNVKVTHSDGRIWNTGTDGFSEFSVTPQSVGIGNEPNTSLEKIINYKGEVERKLKKGAIYNTNGQLIANLAGKNTGWNFTEGLTGKASGIYKFFASTEDNNQVYGTIKYVEGEIKGITQNIIQNKIKSSINRTRGNNFENNNKYGTERTDYLFNAGDVAEVITNSQGQIPDTTEVHFQPQQTTSILNILLQQFHEGTNLNVNVYDLHGYLEGDDRKPVTGKTIYIIKDDEVIAQATTDATGSARFIDDNNGTLLNEIPKNEEVSIFAEGDDYFGFYITKTFSEYDNELNLPVPKYETEIDGNIFKLEPYLLKGIFDLGMPFKQADVPFVILDQDFRVNHYDQIWNILNDNTTEILGEWTGNYFPYNEELHAGDRGIELDRGSNITNSFVDEEGFTNQSESFISGISSRLIIHEAIYRAFGGGEMPWWYMNNWFEFGSQFDSSLGPNYNLYLGSNDEKFDKFIMRTATRFAKEQEDNGDTGFPENFRNLFGDRYNPDGQYTLPYGN